MLEFERMQPGPNPKFVELARAMRSHYPEAESWPRGDPVAVAESCRDAVWAFSLPNEELARMVRHVVKEATALGLVVYGDQIAMAFRPDGRVLPEEMAQRWAELQQHFDEAPQPFGKAQVRKLLATHLRELLTPRGFLMRKGSGEWDVEFVRPVEDGHQTVCSRVDGHSPEFKCTVWCTHRAEKVEAIFHAAFRNERGLGLPHTLWFNVAVLAQAGGETERVPIENMAQIRALLAMVESAMPVLDMAATPGGLDRVMNEPTLFRFPYAEQFPHRPASLADSYIAFGGKSCLKPLIVAWLEKSPRFDERVRSLRPIARLKHLEADLERLLEHLRQRT